MTKENGENVIWLSPPQVSEEFNTNVRTVYRWVERNKVAYKKVGKNLFVTRDSVVEHLRNEQMRQLVSEVLPQDTPNQDLREGVTSSLVRGDMERTQLIARSLEYERTIGELTERTRHLDTLSQEVSGLRQDKVTLTARYERYRVLFWVTLALFVIVISVMSVILYVNM
jgi:hypothetical protein